MAGSVAPFTIDLGHAVMRMRLLIEGVCLPAHIPQYPGDTARVGISLEDLRALQHEWLHDFDWNKEQAQLNTFNHFTTVIEGLTIHFVHQKSKAPGAIPLLLLHGWPGSFMDFLPLVNDLIEVGKTGTSLDVSFDVIIPSLPGFAFSSAPGPKWLMKDSARVFHALMTQALGYEKYAVHGTDFGSVAAWHMYDEYPTAARALHTPFLPFRPYTAKQLAEQNIAVKGGLESFEMQRSDAWHPAESGFFFEQLTKPNTVGLTAHDNPMGQLAWLGEKLIHWSDPRRGTGPSILTNHEILRSVSLYYLTRTFLSAVYIYHQNPPWWPTYVRARTDAPMLVSIFKYNIIWWPKEVAAQIGNLVLYNNHEFGGHFPSMDNPPAVLQDLRHIGEVWEKKSEVNGVGQRELQPAKVADGQEINSFLETKGH